MTADGGPRAAFYALRPGGWRDWWTVLHLPYTAWHLSYAAIGAALAPQLDGGRLAVTLVAFFAAVGVAAHVLDEWHDRPLGTKISSPALLAAAVGGLGVAVVLGVAGVAVVGAVLIPFVVVGVVLVLGYNLEPWGGRLHNDVVFAAGWGAFPLVTGYVVQTGRLAAAAVAGAAAAYGFSWAQRSLSAPARLVRRRARVVRGTMIMKDGTVRAVDDSTLLIPLERALRAMSWSMVALAVAMVAARLD